MLYASDKVVKIELTIRASYPSPSLSPPLNFSYSRFNENRLMPRIDKDLSGVGR